MTIALKPVELTAVHSEKEKTIKIKIYHNQDNDEVLWLFESWVKAFHMIIINFKDPALVFCAAITNEENNEFALTESQADKIIKEGNAFFIYQN